MPSYIDVNGFVIVGGVIIFDSDGNPVSSDRDDEETGSEGKENSVIFDENGNVVGGSSSNNYWPEIDTPSPTFNPTAVPSLSPTTAAPTESPTFKPTALPSLSPTTAAPTKSPTKSPTSNPTTSPTDSPTTSPSRTPTAGPSISPTTTVPTALPTLSLTTVPTVSPTVSPTIFKILIYDSSGNVVGYYDKDGNIVINGEVYDGRNDHEVPQKDASNSTAVDNSGVGYMVGIITDGEGNAIGYIDEDGNIFICKKCIVYDSSGSAIGWIDEDGNVVIDGVIYDGNTGIVLSGGASGNSTAGADGSGYAVGIITDGEGNAVGYIDEDGNIFICKKCIVYDSSGSAIGWIDEDGNVIIDGVIYGGIVYDSNGNPYGGIGGGVNETAANEDVDGSDLAEDLYNDDLFGNTTELSNSTNVTIVIPPISVDRDGEMNEDDDDSLGMAVALSGAAIAALLIGLLLYKKQRRTMTASEYNNMMASDYVLVGTGDHPDSFHEGLYHYTPKAVRYLSTRCEHCLETRRNSLYMDLSDRSLPTIHEEEAMYGQSLDSDNSLVGFTSPDSKDLGGRHLGIDVHDCTSATCPRCNAGNSSVQFVNSLNKDTGALTALRNQQYCMTQREARAYRNDDLEDFSEAETGSV